MSARSFGWLGAFGLIAMVTSAAFPGCGNSIETVPYVPTGGALPTGGGGGSGPGGAGGSDASRGDPGDFPTDCLTSCDDACARLAECGGESSELYPVTPEQCAARCAFQESSPYWDDQSAHFKCCTAQTECSDVQHCGGWIAHDAVAASCETFCECMMGGGAIGELTAGHEAPEGYRFAPDRVMVELVDPSPAGLRALEQRVAGIRVTGHGSRALVELGEHAAADALVQIGAAGRLMPTLLDARGRVAAVTGKVVLAIESPVAIPEAVRRVTRFGLPVPRQLKMRIVRGTPATIHVVDTADGWHALRVVRELDSIDGVRAELDMLRRYRYAYQPNDPRFGDQWHLLNTGQGGAVIGADGRVSEAWDRTFGDSQVIVAINDDGVDLNHPDFVGQLEPELNYPSDWESLMASEDWGWHGTSCAGVAAAAGDNEEGGVGVCPGCRLLPHLLGPSNGLGFDVTDSEIAEGFEQMVDAGAWVISNSWGPDTGDPVFDAPAFPLPALPSVVKAALDYAETEGRGGLGTVVVFAAGNSNDVIDPVTGYETNVTVAAVSDLGTKSYYSSFGSEVDIAAPTNGGLGGITTTANRSEYTDEFGGTSSACPFIAGAAGLVLSANPALTAAEVRQVLYASATKIDPVFGQWDEQGRSPFYGAGLVNAAVAVELASGDCTDPADCPAASDDCDASCGSVGSCGACRTAADCAEGYVCQALPSLGASLCVAEKGTEPCPGGTTEREGYCLPSAQTCGLCGGQEECNGRDDDCNGEVDDGDVCEGYTRCFDDGPGCPAGEICAGTVCRTACNDDADCGEQGSCETLKDSYGAVPGPKGCVSSGVGMCQLGCESLISSFEDSALESWVDCMQDGAASCMEAYSCMSLLPLDE